MKFISTELDGVLVVAPDVFRDARGFFLETYQHRKYCEGGIEALFVQGQQATAGEIGWISQTGLGSLRGV